MLRSFGENVFVTCPTIEVKFPLFVLDVFYCAEGDFQECPSGIFFWAEYERNFWDLTKIRKWEIFREWSVPNKKVGMISGISCWSNSTVFHLWTEFPSLNAFLSRNDNCILLHVLANIYESSLDGSQSIPIDLIGFEHGSPLETSVYRVRDKETESD